MTQFILNIGLDGTDSVSVINALQHVGYLKSSIRFDIAQSNSERTVIIHVENSENVYTVYNTVYDLSVHLNQDCIAVCILDNITGKIKTGELIGPRAYKWGAFSPEYFLV